MSGRILVTGATGFVGRALVARLATEGYSARSAVRRPDGTPGEVVAVGEIGSDTDWSRALEGIDAVVHLAGRAHVLRHESDALASFRRVNVEGTARLARQAEQARVRRFVLISSVKAAAESTRVSSSFEIQSPPPSPPPSWGRALRESLPLDGGGRPAGPGGGVGTEPAGKSADGVEILRESDPPHPRTPYGISKLEGEQALRIAARHMETVVLRPPLVYGPGVRANFEALLRLVGSGVPIPLGSVRNRRSLIALANLVDAIVTALHAEGAAGGTFFVADGPPLSTPALIKGLAAALGRPARLFPFPPGLLAAAAAMFGRAEQAESLLGSLVVDDSAFRAATGWRPPLDQPAGFSAVASWYKAAKGIP